MLQEETRKHVARGVVIYFFGACLIFFVWQLLAMAIGYHQLKPSFLFDWLTTNICIPTFRWIGQQIANAAHLSVTLVKETFAFVSYWTGQIFSLIGDILSFISRLPGHLWRAMSHILSCIWSHTKIILDWMATHFKLIVDWIHGYWTWFMNWLSNVWNYIWLTLLQPIGQWMWARFKAFFIGIYELAVILGTRLLNLANSLYVWMANLANSLAIWISNMAVWFGNLAVSWAKWFWSSIILYLVDLADIFRLWIIKQVQWLAPLIVTRFQHFAFGSWAYLKTWAWFAYSLMTEIYMLLWEIVIAIMELSKFNLAARAASELVVSGWRLATSWVWTPRFFSVSMEGYFTQKTLSVALSLVLGGSAVALFFFA